MKVRVSLDPHFRLLNLAFVVQLVDQDKQRIVALFPGQNLTAVVIMLFTGGDNVTPGGRDGEQNRLRTCAHTQLKRGINAVIRVKVVFIDNRQAGVSPLDGGRFSRQRL
ncbi:Uncharacterised protein [Enterobacter cloacae]|nr:Uncharacterised protein [Enterobacter cloacae]